MATATSINKLDTCSIAHKSDEYNKCAFESQNIEQGISNVEAPAQAISTSAVRNSLFNIPSFKYFYLDHINSEMKPEEISPKLQSPVFVLFTSMDRTLKALEKASQLAESLHKSIEILVVQTVPFALPLEAPPVSNEFLMERLGEMADRFPIQIKISAYLCRDPMIALKRIIKRNCQVVLGVPKTRWRPTRDHKLARMLSHTGFDVIAVETE